MVSVSAPGAIAPGGPVDAPQPSVWEPPRTDFAEALRAALGDWARWNEAQLSTWEPPTGDDDAYVAVPIGRSDPSVGGCVPPLGDFSCGTANGRSDPHATANRRSDPCIAMGDGGDSTNRLADAWARRLQARPPPHNVTLAEAYYVLVVALLQYIIRRRV